MNQKKFKLVIELVPSTVWFSSLYQIYKNSNQLNKWRKIKKELFEKEGNRCWICGKEEKHLEAHEFWEYDDKNHIQKLVAIHHLSEICNRIKHIGFWCYSQEGKQQLAKAGLSREDLIDHFCKVNKCSKEEFEKHEKRSP